ncbi:MAG TPA: ABC transporter ATP-binding protein [Pseudorhodoplanes sp.]|nr:ABC transporter ATP-binding protein [Pseudorhodoplanes sp.]
MSPASPLLTVRDATIRFGGVAALDGLSFDAARGEILGIIGPNGSGKTSLLNSLSGLYRPQRGEILFDGYSLSGLPPHRIARLGVARTFQHAALFESMTILDNVAVGAHGRDLDDHIHSLLRRLRLADAAQRQVADMAPNMRKRAELARALASRPRLLLLDEPAAGLDAADLPELADLLRDLRDKEGVTILIVEHRMGFVLPLADRVMAMDFGRAISQGTPGAVRNDPAVVRAYLGRAA